MTRLARVASAIVLTATLSTACSSGASHPGRFATPTRIATPTPTPTPKLRRDCESPLNNAIPTMYLEDERPSSKFSAGFLFAYVADKHLLCAQASTMADSPVHFELDLQACDIAAIRHCPARDDDSGASHGGADEFVDLTNSVPFKRDTQCYVVHFRTGNSAGALIAPISVVTGRVGAHGFKPMPCP